MTDSYLILAKVLKNSTEETLKSKIRQLFMALCELRIPSINKFLSDNLTARDILKSCGVNITSLENIDSLQRRAESLMAEPLLDSSELINGYEISNFCKDWKSLMIIHHEVWSTIEGKQLINMILSTFSRIADFSWSSFESGYSKDKHKEILKSIVAIWEWLLNQENYHVVYDVALIDWMLAKLSKIFTPAVNNSRSELYHIGIYLERILLKLVKMNNSDVNEILEAVSFGEVFGQHLQLQYENLRLCQVHKTPPYDDYAEENNIRLNTFKYLLRSNSIKLHSQFIKSNFIEKMVSEYIKNKQRFVSCFDKIDLKFLAFRQWYPLRGESIGFIREVIDARDYAKNIYAEVIQRIDMYLLIPHECQILETYDNEEEFLVQSSLLLLSTLIKTISGDKKDDRFVETINEEIGRAHV